MSFTKTIGSRLEVWNGTAKATGYGPNALEKKDLVRIAPKHPGESARIVSKVKHEHVPEQLKVWQKSLKSAKKELGIKKAKKGEPARMVTGEWADLAREKFAKKYHA